MEYSEGFCQECGEKKMRTKVIWHPVIGEQKRLCRDCISGIAEDVEFRNQNFTQLFG